MRASGSRVALATITWAAVTFAAIALATASARADERYGAVVFYGAPIEAGGPSGGAFAGATEQAALDDAVDSCQRNTVAAERINCTRGRWIATGRHLLVASVCEATDTNGDPHRLLFFLKDGVTASDGEIRDAALREMANGSIAENGCRKVAVFDQTTPVQTVPNSMLIARSVAKDKAPAGK